MCDLCCVVFVHLYCIAQNIGGRNHRENFEGVVMSCKISQILCYTLCVCVCGCVRTCVCVCVPVVMWYLSLHVDVCELNSFSLDIVSNR